MSNSGEILRQYILVLGAPRSGTTLISSMIAAHPDVAFLIEDIFFSIKKLTGKRVLGNKLCIPHQMELYHRATLLSKLIKKTGLLKNYPASKYTIEDYLELGNIKIIGILRNANDVIPSIIKRGKKEFDIAFGRWVRAIRIFSELNARHKDKFVIISFEDLVLNPSSMLQKLCKMISLEFDPRMLEGHKYNIIYPGLKGIDQSKAFRYKHETNNFNLEERFPEIMAEYKVLHEYRLKS